MGKTASRRVLVWLLLITGLALLLRAINLNSDLWLDEIASVRNFSNASITTILTSYNSTNNHLLNSLLVRGMSSLIGTQEWMLRLPALFFGVLAVPSMFWLARRYFRPYASLIAALALAVAYQHIFFSQNARGYTAYFLFALISSASLSRGLQTDQRAWWLGYMVSALLGMMSHLTMSFLIAGHGLVALIWLISQRKTGRLLPMLRRVISVYVILGTLCALVYFSVIQQALSLVSTVYQRDAAVGFQPVSLEFFAELVRSFSLSVSPLLLIAAIPAGLIGLIAAVSLLRRNWTLLVALSLGPVIHFAFSIVQGLAFSPRFLFVLLIPAILVGIEAIRLIAGVFYRPDSNITQKHEGAKLINRLVWIVGTLGLIGVLALPLRNYYDVPKQPYRTAIAYIESMRDTNQLVVAVDVTEQGFRYYGGAIADDVVYVRSVEALDQAIAQAGERGTIVVTTLERGLAISAPDLYARIHADWVQAARFRASVGDGDIYVYVLP